MDDVEKDEQRAEKIKDFCRDRVLKKQAEMAEFLEGVALNPACRDKKIVKGDNGERIVDVPISMNLRVAAAKVWKEMFADKAVGDVKEKAKQERAKGINMKAVLEKLGAEMGKDPSEDEKEL